MNQILYINAMLFVLLYTFKIRRYADKKNIKAINDLGYSLMLLIVPFILGTFPLSTKITDDYIILVYRFRWIFALLAIIILCNLLIKKRLELLQAIFHTFRNGWNIFEIIILTTMAVVAYFGQSIWLLLGSFAVLSVLIAREAFIMALKINKEAGA